MQSDPAGGEAQFVTLPGWANGGPIVVKMGRRLSTEHEPHAPAAGRSRAVALFDGKTGGPLLIADGAAMTARKNSRGFRSRRRHTRPRGVEDLLVVGAGALAPHSRSASRRTPLAAAGHDSGTAPLQGRGCRGQLREKGIDAVVARTSMTPSPAPMWCLASPCRTRRWSRARFCGPAPISISSVPICLIFEKRTTRP